jgi:hypothetical protein
MDRKRKYQRQATRNESDHAIAPAGDAAIEPFEPAVPFDRHDLAEKLRRLDNVRACESVTLGEEAISRAVDHPVHEEPSRRRFVTDHVADANPRRGGRHHECHVAGAHKGQHAAAPGLDPERVTTVQHLDGELVGSTHRRRMIAYATGATKGKRGGGPMRDPR